MKKKKKEKFSQGYGLYMGKIITDGWAIITLLIFTLDFFSGNQIDATAGAVGVIYIAVLGIFVGSKEFERWHGKTYPSRYFGEIYVIIWSALMICFAVLAPLSGGYYKVPQEFVVTYIAILGILAITHRSKQMHKKRTNKA